MNRIESDNKSKIEFSRRNYSQSHAEKWKQLNTLY